MSNPEIVAKLRRLLGDGEEKGEVDTSCSRFHPSRLLRVRFNNKVAIARTHEDGSEFPLTADDLVDGMLVTKNEIIEGCLVGEYHDS